MPSPTPDPRLRRAERGLLALSGVLGIAASIWAFASRELTDFLGEGPVRVLSLSDAAQQTTIAVGLLLAALAWTALALAPLPLWRYVLAGVTALVAVALAPALLLPMAALVALAALLAVLGSMSPDRRAALAPDRHPRAWAGSGAVALAGLVVASVVSVWLLRPLFDEGKQLDEALAFDLPAAATPAPPLPAGAVATATPAASAPAASTPASSGGAAVLATGQLQGTDAFHFGSGKVLLVRGPEGQLLLRFEDYEVRNGPDLFIYLTPDPKGDPEAKGALNLGAIKATKGNVNYEVTAGTDITSFRSAVIWCRSFDVVFAVATFQ